VAETNGLLNRRTENSVPRVRIPPSPPEPRFSLFKVAPEWGLKHLFSVIFLFDRVQSRLIASRLLCGKKCWSKLLALFGKGGAWANLLQLR
jgi:hypothetical protein